MSIELVEQFVLFLHDFDGLIGLTDLPVEFQNPRLLKTSEESGLIQFFGHRPSERRSTDPRIGRLWLWRWHIVTPRERNWITMVEFLNQAAAEPGRWAIGLTAAGEADADRLSQTTEPERDDDSQPERDVLYHAAGETPPAEYPGGPLTGSKRDVAQWILRSSDRRSMETPLKTGTYWAREDSRYQVSVWFKTQERFAEANGTKRADD